MVRYCYFTIYIMYLCKLRIFMIFLLSSIVLQCLFINFPNK